MSNIPDYVKSIEVIYTGDDRIAEDFTLCPFCSAFVFNDEMQHHLENECTASRIYSSNRVTYLEIEITDGCTAGADRNGAGDDPSEW